MKNVFSLISGANPVKTINFEQLRELVLIEDFKNSLPDKIVVYLNEKKVSILAEAAVSADEFVLTAQKCVCSTCSTRITVFCEFG